MTHVLVANANAKKLAYSTLCLATGYLVYRRFQARRGYCALQVPPDVQS